jgi:1-acyl-sn-glycerol-3-phosphate acyltransferase
MALVRSLAFALIFYAGTILCVLTALAASLFGRRPMLGVILFWIHFHGWCTRALLGITRRVEGPMPEGAVLVAAKHQSMYETLEIVSLLDLPAIVMKQQLSAIPLWGWLARSYGMIPVDRAGGAAALRRMMRAAEAPIAEGRALMIFPEGTRVAPGEQPPLQPGFAGLYRALKLPVVPLAIDSGRLWPRGRFIKRSGIVTFRFAPPIPPGLKRDEIESAVHEAINALDRPRDA